LAGVVDDVPLHELSEERLAQSMAAKVAGAWNLHCLTAGDPLDHFTMFSSVSALVGPPAQGAYAAANAFLDGFARYRRERGLPAQSIAWGPWREAGMAVQTGAAGRAASYGFAPLATDDALRMLSAVLVNGDASTVIAPLNRLGLRRYRGQTSRAPLLADLFDRFSGAAPSTDVVTPFVEAFHEARDREERLDLVRTMLRNAIAAVLGLPAAEVDDNAEFRSLGLDSLTGMELSVRVANELGVAVDAAAVLLYPTTSALAALLEAKMTAALDSDARVGLA
jgi:acyl carrier protein